MMFMVIQKPLYLEQLGFWQYSLDFKIAHIDYIVTQIGMYQWRRLHFGLV